MAANCQSRMWVYERHPKPFGWLVAFAADRSFKGIPRFDANTITGLDRENGIRIGADLVMVLALRGLGQVVQTRLASPTDAASGDNGIIQPYGVRCSCHCPAPSYDNYLDLLYSTVSQDPAFCSTGRPLATSGGKIAQQARIIANLTGRPFQRD